MKTFVFVFGIEIFMNLKRSKLRTVLSNLLKEFIIIFTMSINVNCDIFQSLESNWIRMIFNALSKVISDDGQAKCLERFALAEEMFDYGVDWTSLSDSKVSDEGMVVDDFEHSLFGMLLSKVKHHNISPNIMTFSELVKPLAHPKQHWPKVPEESDKRK